MCAHLVEQAQVGSLGDEEVVDRAEHRAEAVGIGQPPFVIAGGTAVFHRLAATLDLALEQPARIDAFELAKLLARKVIGLGRFRAGQDGPGESPLRPFMHSQKRKRIGVCAFQQGFNRACWWLHLTPQMSLAYSPMVRSEENQPTLAMFRIADARQAFWSSHFASTARCAAV
jgi:hypothetical protein